MIENELYIPCVDTPETSGLEIRPINDNEYVLTMDDEEFQGVMVLSLDNVLKIIDWFNRHLEY